MRRIPMLLASILPVAAIAMADPPEFAPVLIGELNAHFGFGDYVYHAAPAFDGTTLAVSSVAVAGTVNPTSNATLLRLSLSGASESVATSSYYGGGGSQTYIASSPSIGSGLIVFQTIGEGLFTDSELLGIYATPAGADAVERIAGFDSAWPTPPLIRVALLRASSWGDRIAFAALHYHELNSFTPYVFVYEAQRGLVELAGPTTPGLPANVFGLSDASLSQAACAFSALTDDGVQTIHRREILGDGFGPVETWASNGDALPQGGGTLAGIEQVQIDRARGGAVCFVGYGSPGAAQAGVYIASASGIEYVADTNTLIPNGAGSFERFWNCAIDDGVVAFLATGSDGQVGVYRKLAGLSLEKVVARGDLLEGYVALGVTFDREGLAGGRIAFSAVLDRGTNIFGPMSQSMVFVPEPGSLPLALAALAALGLRRAIASRRYPISC